MWEGMFLQNPVHANWTSVCLRFPGKIPFFAWCTMHWDLWIIHVILKPGLDYLWWSVWILEVLYWEDKSSHLDLDEQTGSNMAFCCWFLSLGLLLVLSPASHSRLVCMVSATLFYQGPLTSLFSWLTDAYSAPIFLQGSSTMVWSHCLLLSVSVKMLILSVMVA